MIKKKSDVEINIIYPKQKKLLQILKCKRNIILHFFHTISVSERVFAGNCSRPLNKNEIIKKDFMLIIKISNLSTCTRHILTREIKYLYIVSKKEKKI